MLFSSMIFLWIFLPIVISVYYLLNLIIVEETKRVQYKNLFLLIASLVFYSWGGIYFLSIMICTIIINFCGGYFLSKISKENYKKRVIILVITIILNLAILFYFKYFNMVIIAIEQTMAHPNDFITCINNIFNMERTGELNIKEIVLPIGISFFTFQAMSYVIDVYRNDAETQKSIFDFGLYVALFPQLIAGPIVKYKDIAHQIVNRSENIDKFFYGIKRFCYGIGKKVILANTFAVIVDGIWGLELNNLGLAISWFGAISYAFQIYYDFSGYSDMAIGLGNMFGFEFKENFNYPYMSLSIADFWRRWHISLSTWFKEYVYIPLGGNRKGLYKTCLNIFIVFLLTGIWHGANWTFIIWGIAYAIMQILERLFLGKLLEKNKFKFINWFYTIFVVIILWIVFRANTIYDAITYIKQLTSIESSYSIFTYLSMKNIIVLIFAILGMGVIKNICGKFYDKIKNNYFIIFADIVFQMLILSYSILSIVSGTYNPFIYFQF